MPCYVSCIYLHSDYTMFLLMCGLIYVQLVWLYQGGYMEGVETMPTSYAGFP